MEPLWPEIERACTVPEMLTALRAASRAVAAEMITLPPLALIVPEFLTSASSPPALVGTATCKKPSPEKSSAACSPEQIGRASWRERVCPYGEISVVAG